MIERFIAALLVGTLVIGACVAPAFSAEQFPLTPWTYAVPVKVGGKTLMMVLDTGSTGTVLDSRHQALLGEATGSDFFADKPESTINLYSLRDLNVGAIKTSLPKVACLPLGDPIVGAGIDGLLGMDFLKDYRIEYDWENEKVTLHDKPVDIHDALATVPISINIWNLPVVVGKINGRNLQFVIDTGDFSFVSLSPGDQVFALRGELGKAVDSPRWGVHGRIDWKVTRIPSLGIGSCAWSNVICDVDGPQNARSNVGMRFFEAYHTIIDVPKRKLIFVRRNENADSPDINMGGMTVLRLNIETVVYRIEDAGPAEASHIEKGDVLLELDGKDCSNLDIGQIRRILRSGDGKHVLLKIKHGSAVREVDLVLRRRI